MARIVSRQGISKLAIMALLVIGNCGCISLAANLLGVINGNGIPAEYEGLEEQRVAIVCTSTGGSKVDPVATTLTSYMHANFKTNIKDIDLVRQSKVENWTANNDLDEDAFIQIGKGVDADKVVVVEIDNLKLKNGQTLYRGQADIRITVYDIADGGDIVYHKELLEFVYPRLGGPSVTDTSETRFRGLFLSVLADKISGLFYQMDATHDVALDAKAASL